MLLLTAALIPIADVGGEPTYHGQISRLLQSKCIKCHHEGGIAPEDWSRYESVVDFAPRIRAFVSSGKMPPWNAAPLEEQGYAPGQGLFPNNELSREQIDLLVNWIDLGAPEGDPADAPPPLEFQDGWFQGEPDLILNMPVEWEHPPGPDHYRCYLLETASTGALEVDRVLTGIEIRPGNLEIVHHADVYLVDEAAALAAQADDAVTPGVPNDGWDCFGDSGIGGIIFSGYAPGSSTSTLLSDELGMLLPADKRLALQIHYHNETPEPLRDRTRVGLRFAPNPDIPLVTVDTPTHFPGLTNPAIAGPASMRSDDLGRLGYGPMLPGETNVYSLLYPIPYDSHLVALWPHMHLTGTEFLITALLPNQEERPLLYLDQWDFYWQLIYNFKKPIPLPQGTLLSVEATFFNNTSAPIIGGLFSSEEMITLGLTISDDSMGIPAAKDTAPPAVAAELEVLTGSSALNLTVTFGEPVAQPHYPSDFEIVGPKGRLPAPDSITVSGAKLILEYDGAVHAGAEPAEHALVLRGFFGIEDLAGNFLDGNGNGIGSELADDIVLNFLWAGLDGEGENPTPVGCAALPSLSRSSMFNAHGGDRAIFGLMTLALVLYRPTMRRTRRKTSGTSP